MDPNTAIQLTAVVLIPLLFGPREFAGTTLLVASIPMNLLGRLFGFRWQGLGWTLHGAAVGTWGLGFIPGVTPALAWSPLVLTALAVWYASATGITMEGGHRKAE